MSEEVCNKRKEALRIIDECSNNIKLPPPSTTSIDTYWENLQRDGVIVIEDLYSIETIDALNKASKIVYDHVNEMVKEGVAKDTSITWIAEHSQLDYLKKVNYTYDNTTNIFLGGGRYDYQWAMTQGIFNKSEVYFPSPLKN